MGKETDDFGLVQDEAGTEIYPYGDFVSVPPVSFGQVTTRFYDDGFNIIPYDVAYMDEPPQPFVPQPHIPVKPTQTYDEWVAAFFADDGLRDNNGLLPPAPEPVRPGPHLRLVHSKTDPK